MPNPLREIVHFEDKKKGLDPLRRIWLRRMHSVIRLVSASEAAAQLQVEWVKREPSRKTLSIILTYANHLNRAIGLFEATWACGGNLLDLLSKFGWQFEWESWQISQNLLERLEEHMENSLRDLEEMLDSHDFTDLLAKLNSIMSAEAKTDFSINIHEPDLWSWHKTNLKLKEATLTLERAAEAITLALSGVEG